MLYDVAVIGGGPAGMMAAGRAASLGAKVILIEKNAKLGKKLLITGGGRCNITNAETDVKKMVARYGVKGKALIGSFTRFGVAETMEFFESRGLHLTVEAEKRAFPDTKKAEDVWKFFVNYLKEGKVEILFSSPVVKILSNDGKITGIKLANREVKAKNYIVATGGNSVPETGSTGDGFKWMKEIGHKVEEADSALVPVKIKEQWVKELSGLSFKNTKLAIIQDGKKQESRTGKMLLTHFGLSGPLVLNMSKAIADLFRYGPVTLELDLYPDLDYAALDAKILQHLTTALNKKIRNNLGEIVPPKMIPIVLEMTAID